jgi:nicotinamide-nucleotide amidase
MITNVAGSSDYFLFSGITYSNQSKIDVLGVSPETIRDCGAVHEQTVKEMATGVKNISGATYGIATSGIAGPGGGTDDKPVGTLCVGIATPEEVKSFTLNLNFGKRVMNKTIFAMIALELLRKELLGLPA